MAAIVFRNRVPPLDGQQLEAISKVLADTDTGLTGSQIGHLLEECAIPDVSPGTTKWKRLYNAFVEFQNQQMVGNHVVKFINKAMSPVSYADQPEVFRERRDRLNTVLALCGMTIGDDGRVRAAARAANLDEALERANRLKAELTRRKVHPDVLRHCSAEILQRNYFHAVEEAMKSITTKIRRLSDLTCDGADLADGAFSLGKSVAPLLALSPLDTETLRNEQKGFVNLLKGLYGTIRNPLAHEAKIEWEMNEQDALDILTMISLVHRKLDKTTHSDAKP